MTLQMREGEAPSYYNPFEAEQLVALVTGLLSQHERTAAVTAADIGVICTYRKQVPGTMRSATTTELLAKRKLMYHRTSQCLAARCPVVFGNTS